VFKAISFQRGRVEIYPESGSIRNQHMAPLIYQRLNDQIILTKEVPDDITG
jgi:hypothetical protein